MDLGSIFIFLALLILVGMFVGKPFFDQPNRKLIKISQKNENEVPRSRLLAHRDRVLAAIQDLEFDHSLNKISEDDFKKQRDTLMKSGADILRQLDVLKMETSSNEEIGIPAPEIEAVGNLDDDLEALIQDRRQNHKEKAASFCHKCGNPIQKKDKFCSRCGTLSN
ncbi:MAG: zinc ribbon domain-containing protein [Anaerolineaceae bacterium]|nr:zinc ribbon domain-containing protein [Anaerolineaceae bacterium]